MDVNRGYLHCASCNARYKASDSRWRCECGGYLDFIFPSELDEWHILPDATDIWRYLPMLPLHQRPVALGEPRTPLVSLNWHDIDVRVKCEHLFPTGSFKDRGAALMLAKAQEFTIHDVIEDSSGNAGAAVAAYAAANGMHAHIYVPDYTSPAKQRQITRYGATLHAVPGSRETAAHAALQAASATWFASHCWNPWFVQGIQTFAFELYEQMGNSAPDTLLLPVGNGTLLLGAWLGFIRLSALGLIKKPPRLVAVQAASCAPLYHAFHASKMNRTTSSVAQGICVSAPLRSKQILGAIRASGGTVTIVTEQQIVAAHHQLAERGILVEPTSAVVFAALANRFSAVSKDDKLVTVFTGHGLKSP